MAAPLAYSGALQPKKKAELQEIALALQISDQGTKDDLQARIKKHLDANQAELEDEPVFSGLFGRKSVGGRKRTASAQPLQHQGPPPPITRFAPSQEPISSSSVQLTPKPSLTNRRITPIDPIPESPAELEMADVSTMLKAPFSFSPNPQAVATGTSLSPRSKSKDFGTPSSQTPPGPRTRRRSSILDYTVRPLVTVVRRQEELVLQSGGDMLVSLRAFLSNSRTIWSLTAFLELMYILAAIVPWKSIELPVSSSLSHKSPTLHLNYPMISVFRSSSFWIVLLHWAIPTLLIPAIFGTLISFTPAPPPKPASSSDHQRSYYQPGPPNLDLKESRANFDPLTASIVSLAAQVAYPYGLINKNVNLIMRVGSGPRVIQGVDVLGVKWRVLAAGVGLAFAFAEAIAGAPAAYARSLEGAKEVKIRDLRVEKASVASGISGML